MPSTIGLSWFAVLPRRSVAPSHTSQAQPLPNTVVAAAANRSRKASTLPNASSIAEPSSPPGSPPPSGLMISQKSEWFAWPPPFRRNAVPRSSPSRSTCASTSSTGRSAHSVPSSASFALST